MYLDLVTLPTVVRNAKGDFMRGTDEVNAYRRCFERNGHPGS